MFKLSIAEKKSIWDQYVALLKARQSTPDYWTQKHCTRVLTNLMAGRDFSWHVVGITKNALQQYKSQNFRSISRDGITRGHIVPRAQTANYLINLIEPAPLEDFFKIWLANDKTVLCAKGENKKILPEFIPFENKLNLFNCKDMIVGHRHKSEEVLFLKNLYSTYFGARVSDN